MKVVQTSDLEPTGLRVLIDLVDCPLTIEITAERSSAATGANRR